MKTQNFSTNIIYLLVALSGFATLSWEVIWQIKASLALGISERGTAITLAIIMGGMSLGAFLMGRIRPSVKGLYFYGLLEFLIGSTCLFLNSFLYYVEKLDTWSYAVMPGSGYMVYVLGLIAAFGFPTLCMGATIPLFGVIAQEHDVTVAKLYRFNILGAALGALIVAFVLIPFLGLTRTIISIASINILVGVIAWMLKPARKITTEKPDDTNRLEFPFSQQLFIVFVTGFATFTLEIAWFRSLSNVFPNTTDVFAIMLAVILIALGKGAKKVPLLKQKQKSLATQLCVAGILILLFTPLIERLDYVNIYLKQAADFFTKEPPPYSASLLNWLMDPITFTLNGISTLYYALSTLTKFLLLYLIIVPPIRFLGTAFPWILDAQRSSQIIGKLYAINTLAAITGSIGAAWLLLPMVGFAKTAWIAGTLVVISGLVISVGNRRFLWAVSGMAALSISMVFATGIGTARVQGFFASDKKGNEAKVLGFFEGPLVTTSAVEYLDGTHALLIGSTMAAWESGQTYRPSIHYMSWMGHLPMLLQQAPGKALVICFGTGQTANAVRKEKPAALDIVDINPSVFKLAHYFRSNEAVLEDPMVKAIVMDGRAYMRRTQKIYDVITLEPMPPTMAGVNALYSREFYQLARAKLSPQGIIAQWLPFHITSPYYSASIAKTFISVFPNAILWIDQYSKTGILLGAKDNNFSFKKNWPGFARTDITRDLSSAQVQQSIALDSKGLEQYGNYGTVITDDNELLAYGKALYVGGLLNENFALLRKINPAIPMVKLDASFS